MLKEKPQQISELVFKREKISQLLFLEGFFDAEGCVKIIKEPVRKTPKICPDITNTELEYLEITGKILLQQLGIEARYSSQEAYLSKDGHPRKKSYHLRIYKKEYARKFFENIHTTKLKPEKLQYVENWLDYTRKASA